MPVPVLSQEKKESGTPSFSKTVFLQLHEKIYISVTNQCQLLWPNNSRSVGFSALSLEGVKTRPQVCLNHFIEARPLTVLEN